jgi:hypothetical protein
MHHLLSHPTILGLCSAARRGDGDTVHALSAALRKECEDPKSNLPVLDLAVALMAIDEANTQAPSVDFIDHDSPYVLRARLSKEAMRRKKDTLRLCLEAVERHGDTGKFVAEEIHRAVEQDEGGWSWPELALLLKHAENRADILEDDEDPANDR